MGNSGNALEFSQVYENVLFSCSMPLYTVQTCYGHSVMLHTSFGFFSRDKQSSADTHISAQALSTDCFHFQI